MDKAYLIVAIVLVFSFLLYLILDYQKEKNREYNDEDMHQINRGKDMARIIGSIFILGALIYRLFKD